MDKTSGQKATISGKGGANQFRVPARVIKREDIIPSTGKKHKNGPLGMHQKDMNASDFGNQLNSQNLVGDYDNYAASHYKHDSVAGGGSTIKDKSSEMGGVSGGGHDALTSQSDWHQHWNKHDETKQSAQPSIKHNESFERLYSCFDQNKDSNQHSPVKRKEEKHSGASNYPISLRSQEFSKDDE